MEEMFKPEVFNMVLMTMSVMAVFVFVCLLKVEAGYGVAYTKKWGPAVNNKLGWVLMEAPAFIAMVVLWLLSDRACDGVRCTMAAPTLPCPLIMKETGFWVAARARSLLTSS